MPEAAISRVDIGLWEIVRVESRGASAKIWVREPGGSSSKPETDWLFKPVTTHTNGVRQMGDWTEAIGSALARSLGIPAAVSQMALRGAEEGVLVRNVNRPGYDMVTGRLAMLDEIEVELRDSARDKTASVGHSVDNIFRTLERYGPPPGYDLWADCTAVDVMVGYLVLDGLIGNGDRHEQNWSVLRSRLGDESTADALSATYDLEASLGFQLSDGQRTERLRDRRGMEAFAEKGLARRFHGDRSTTLVDLASRAYSGCSDTGKLRIQQLINDISTADFDAIAERVGGMSEATSTFALKVLDINRRRISDASWNA